MDVRMPDGTIITGVPEGTTQSELRRRLALFDKRPARAAFQGEEPAPRSRPVRPRPNVTPAVAGAQAGLRRFTDNVINTPDALVNMVLGLAGSDRRVDFVPSFDDIAAAGQGLQGAAGALLQGEPANLSQRIAAERQQIAQAIAAQQQGAPIATGAGEFTGDIATLLTGRAGVRGVAQATNLQQLAPVLRANATTGMGRALQTFARSVGRSGKRALETGAEGAFLASLQGADVQEVAAGGAAAQIVGDVALSTFRKFAKPASLLVAIGTATVVSNGLEGITPGGQNRILPNIEEKTKEAILALLIGGAAGAAIGGRIPKDQPLKVLGGPAFAELVDVTRRGALLSLIGSMTRDPNVTGPVVKKFSQDPDFFGPKAKVALQRAINSDKIEIRNTIDELMKDRGFKRRFDQLIEGRP